MLLTITNKETREEKVFNSFEETVHFLLNEDEVMVEIFNSKLDEIFDSLILPKYLEKYEIYCLEDLEGNELSLTIFLLDKKTEFMEEGYYDTVDEDCYQEILEDYLDRWTLFELGRPRKTKEEFFKMEDFQKFKRIIQTKFAISEWCNEFGLNEDELCYHLYLGLKEHYNGMSIGEDEHILSAEWITKNDIKNALKNEFPNKSRKRGDNPFPN